MAVKTVAQAMHDSTADFLRLVWPVVGTNLGTIAPVETVSANSFARELDVRAGIDHWILRKDGHITGLASRVQWFDHSYDTFTVRVKSRFGGPTEYHKRKAELIDNPRGLMISPYYMCHAYVSKDRTRLVAAAVARTCDVIPAVWNSGRLLPPNDDGTQGWAVPWSGLRKRGALFLVWRGEEDGQMSLFSSANGKLAG